MTVALVVLFGLVGWLVWEFATAPTVPTFEEHTAAALGLLDPPPAAVAALCPDAEPPIPAGWLHDLHTLPTTHEREYPAC